MKNIDIINPIAGKGKPREYINSNKTQYITKAKGDAENFVKRSCLENPDTLFNIYGGDGTINEVVNGIMAAKTNNISKISIIPSGTGNDFYRSIQEIGDDVKVDLIKYSSQSEKDGAFVKNTSEKAVRYVANMINIGFDCDVVKKTDDMKKLPLVNGSTAYILGVADILLHKLGKYFDITLIFPDGSEEKLCGEYLLTAIANGGYCGGGFHATPLSKLNDGIIDLLISKKISRRKFISLVGDYRAGTHIDPKTGQPVEKFSDTLIYRKCIAMKIAGISRICVDGQISDVSEIEVAVEPSAISLVNAKNL